MFEDSGFTTPGAGGGAPGNPARDTTIRDTTIRDAGGAGDGAAGVPDGDEAAAAWLELAGEAFAEQAAVHARLLALIREGETAGVPALLGHGSINTLLADRFRRTPAEAHDLTRQARILATCPETTAALENGEISPAHAAAIAAGILAARKAETARTGTGTGTGAGAGTAGAGAREAEATLLDLAKATDAAAVRGAVKHLRHTIDPDAAAKRHAAKENNARCYYGQTIDGLWHLDAVLGPEGGAILQTALDTLMAQTMKTTKTTETDNTSKAEDTGEKTNATTQRTSAPQARADALIHLAAMALNGGNLTTQGARRPNLTVILPINTLLGHGTQLAHTQWGDLLPTTAAQRIACDAETTIILTDTDNNPLDAGRTKRFVTPKQRTALDARDGGCTYPGCGRPPGWCEAHHLIPWTNGGHSNLDNYTLLCRRHHVHLHAHGHPPEWKTKPPPGQQNTPTTTTTAA